MRKSVVQESCFWPMLVLVTCCFGSTGVNADAVSFQNGVNGYTSTQDTYLQNNLGPAHNSIQLYVQLGDNQYSTRNSLMVFESIFGAGSSQIPIGSSITSATLELHTRNQSDAAGGRVNFHRMLMGWEPKDTKVAYGDPPWNSEDWVQADDFEASSTIGGTFLPDQVNTLYQIDVTSDVQLWANGAPNFGWVMLGDPTGDDDSALFYSSDYANDFSNRPRLIVEFGSVPEPGCIGVAMLGLLAISFRRKRRLR